MVGQFEGNSDLARMKPTAFLINCARGPIVVINVVNPAVRGKTRAGL
jgi:phosphoglycerate dehydrogenase-like enzyme